MGRSCDERVSPMLLLLFCNSTRRKRRHGGEAVTNEACPPHCRSTIKAWGTYRWSVVFSVGVLVSCLSALLSILSYEQPAGQIDAVPCIGFWVAHDRHGYGAIWPYEHHFSHAVPFIGYRYHWHYFV